MNKAIALIIILMVAVMPNLAMAQETETWSIIKPDTEVYLGDTIDLKITGTPTTYFHLSFYNNDTYLLEGSRTGLDGVSIVRIDFYPIFCAGNYTIKLFTDNYPDGVDMGSINIISDVERIVQYYENELTKINDYEDEFYRESYNTIDNKNIQLENYRWFCFILIILIIALMFDSVPFKTKRLLMWKISSDSILLELINVQYKHSINPIKKAWYNYLKKSTELKLCKNKNILEKKEAKE